MLKERTIEKQWVLKTINQPYKIETDIFHSDRLHAFCHIPEFGNRTLRVIYTENDTSIRVITCFFDRKARSAL
jgi:hypothetical protein